MEVRGTSISLTSARDILATAALRSGTGREAPAPGLCDFEIGKGLTNLPALRKVGFSRQPTPAGRPTTQHSPIRAAKAFAAVHEPITTDTGQRVAGLRLGNRRAHSLLQALLVVRLLTRPASATATCASCSPGCSAEPRPRSAPDRSATTYGACASTGLISRIPGTHRYRLTDTGGDTPH
jgi:hypothetical protein